MTSTLIEHETQPVTTSVHVALPDPTHRLAAVDLEQEIRRPRVGPGLRHDDGVWEVVFPVGAVDRVEYRLRVHHPDGRTESICDPDNSLRVPGVFGDKSVVVSPSYTEPTWLVVPAPPRRRLREITIDVPALGTQLEGLVWESPRVRPGAAARLLLVHDGPEYHRYAGLLRFLERETRGGALPPMRAVLLGPVDRDDRYSADEVYADAMATTVLPALQEVAPHGAPDDVVGMGASLGALAMLHLHVRHPGVLGGLFLQSGSYFTEHLDATEHGFRHFDRIARFVASLTDTHVEHVPVAMTCGTVEENLANNRALAQILADAGVAVSLHVNRDAHNYTAWRDCLDPHLSRLAQRTWSSGAR